MLEVDAAGFGLPGPPRRLRRVWDRSRPLVPPLDPTGIRLGELARLVRVLPRREVNQKKVSRARVLIERELVAIPPLGRAFGHRLVQILAQNEEVSELTVAINSDASVRALKGPDRPIFPERERATVDNGARPVLR